MGVDATAGSSGHIQRPRLPFVGRDAELGILLEKVANAPSTTVVSGTAGIGKTRLLAEATERIEGTVLYGRGWRGADTTPYVPWTRVLSAVRQLLGPLETARFRDLVPLLSSGPQRRTRRGAGPPSLGALVSGLGAAPRPPIGQPRGRLRRARGQGPVGQEAILEELQRATGLSGPSRSATTDAERARVRMTKSIRSAIQRTAAGLTLPRKRGR